MANMGLGLALGLSFGHNSGSAGVLWDFTATTKPIAAAGFRRTGLGTLINEAGNVAYGPHNLQTYSDDFTNADWIKRGTATITAGAIAGPVTGSSGTLFENIRAAGVGDVYRQNLTLSAVPTFPTFWVKRVSTSGTLRVTSANGAANGRYDINMALLPDTWSRIAPGNSALTVVTAFVPPGTSWGGLLFECQTGAPLSFYASTVRISYGQVGAEADDAATIATSAAVYLPRYTYHPTTHAALGLLVEPQVTNYCPYSSNLANAAWLTIGGAAKVSHVIDDPSGGLLATRISIVPNTHSYLYIAAPGTGAAAVISSAYLRGTGTLTLAMYDGVGVRTKSITLSSQWVRCDFAYTVSSDVSQLIFGSVSTQLATTSEFDIYLPQLETGSVATSVIPNATASSLVKTTDGNWDITGADFTTLWGAETLGPTQVTNGDFAGGSTGWGSYTAAISGGVCNFSLMPDSNSLSQSCLTVGKRYTLTFDVTRFVTLGTFRVRVGGPDTAVSITGVGAYTITLVATTNTNLFFVKYASTDMDIDNVSVKEVTSERTIIVEWYDTGTALEHGLVMGHVGGSIANEALGLYVNTSNALIYYAKAGGAAQATITAGTIVAGTLAAPARNKAAFRWGSGAFGVTLNGAAEVTGTGTVPTVTDLRVAGGALVAANPHHDSLAKLDRRVTAISGAALQALSAL